MVKSRMETFDSVNFRLHGNDKRPAVGADSAVDVAGKRFHFIGAGGVGMNGLAKLLLKNEAIVTGSDQIPSHIITELCSEGADIKIGHKKDNLSEDVETVVISAAIKEDNPEFKEALSRGCEIKKYARMLGDLMSSYDGIAIAGTHGKSTTSGWLAYCLKEAGVDVNFIVGAEVTQLGSSSGVGQSNYFIAEACEYDRSFLNLRPKVGCILNIEADHLDYYKDENEIVETFGQFAGGIQPGGVLIANGTDSNVARMIDGLAADLRCETFGLNSSCNFYAENMRLIDGLYWFDVYHNGELLGATRISLPGEHNILNALAVVAMSVNTGAGPKEILELLGGFTGIDRRLMLKGQLEGVTIIDDYAHHPTEIKASLAAIRQRYSPGRIWCIFQPHQYSRTRFLLEDFTESFKLADVTIVPEIYFVRDTQEAKKEINSAKLVERIRDNGSEALFIEGFGLICDYLKQNVRAGDLVVTMGAGDVWKVSDEYIQWLREDS